MDLLMCALNRTLKIMLNLQVQCISDKVQHTPTIILLKMG